MDHDQTLSRRRFAGAALTAAGLIATGGIARAAVPAQTADGPMGPFYPILRPGDDDFDMTMIRGNSGRALGRVIEVTGRVLDRKGNPVGGAELELCVTDPEGLSDLITHAGAIFLGAWTPEAIGDYVGGPNHVLPTARSARFSSGLSVMDFLKRTTLAKMTPAALAVIGPAAERLAQSESLQAHALSVRARLDRLNSRTEGDPA